MTPAKPSCPNRSRAQGPLPRGPALLPEPGSEWAWPAHTHTSSRAHAPHWQEAEGGAGQTQNKQPALSHFGAAPPLCPDLVRARLGATAPEATSCPHLCAVGAQAPPPWSRRRVILGRAEGGGKT